MARIQKSEAEVIINIVVLRMVSETHHSETIGCRRDHIGPDGVEIRRTVDSVPNGEDGWQQENVFDLIVI